MKIVACLTAGALLLAGCVSAPPPAAPSPSQQLLDLKRAKESGAIDEQEYDKRIREILHAGTKATEPETS